jgi:hypothetical protein
VYGPFLGGSTDTNLASVTENRNGWASHADFLGRAVTVGTVVGFGAQGFGASVQVTAALSVLTIIITLAWESTWFGTTL